MCSWQDRLFVATYCTYSIYFLRRLPVDRQGLLPKESSRVRQAKRTEDALLGAPTHAALGWTPWQTSQLDRSAENRPARMRARVLLKSIPVEP